MSAEAWSWVVPWTLQSTALALLGLALPRVVRLDAPRRLAWYRTVLLLGLVLPWGASAITPAPGDGTPVDAAVLVATPATLAVAPVVGGWAPSGWSLAALWIAGVCTRAIWLAGGVRRLRRWRRGASRVDDPALARALVTVPVLVDCGASPDVRQPLTWGTRHPVVLVPTTLAERPAAQREAVYVHELLHVARRDMRWVWAEEGLRTLLWPVPAVWMLVPALRLAREQVVDADTVRLTRAPRAYVDALVWCADGAGPRTVPVLPFFRRHQLLTRVASLTREVPMSRLRLAVVAVGLAAVLCGTAAVLSAVAPMPGARLALPVAQSDTAGPLERRAVLPTLDAPLPRRIVGAESDVAGILQPGTSAHYRVHAVIDASGDVAEARIVTAATAGGDDVDTPALRAAVLSAVRQWQFEAPITAPMLVVTNVSVGTPAPPIDMEIPVRAGGAIAVPRRIHDVAPVYPQVARDAKVQGVVILEAIVERTGDVSGVKVLRSIPLLDQAAIDAVRQWKYEPQERRVEMVMTINFTLQADEPKQ